MDQWEYLATSTGNSLTPLTTEQLNELGKQGWELVGFTVSPHIAVYLYVFKRRAR